MEERKKKRKEGNLELDLESVCLLAVCEKSHVNFV